MCPQRISKDLTHGTYFLTLVVHKHLRILPKFNCWNILADSLNYHISRREVSVEGFVFMKDHIHLIVTSEDTIHFVRGFKRFTSKVIKKILPRNIITILNNDEGDFQFWEKSNMPIWIESDYFFQQKLNYIHENPTRAEYVSHEEDWSWSSANYECKVKVDRSDW